jgi:hypothetical protein
MFRLISALLLLLLAASPMPAQVTPLTSVHLLTPEQLDSMFLKPPCLEGYRPWQSGPLIKLNPDGEPTRDSTFSVEPMQIVSDGLRIKGWLYLPLTEGPYPLMVFTNGGGSDPRRVKSLSDFMAPVLAHCGVAALVHDKRGTGESEGVYRETTYEDYIRDAGQWAIQLSRDPRIDATRIGVMGGSEGGRTAVVAASRYPAISFVISMNGTMVSGIDDRMNAQMGAIKASGVSDSVMQVVTPLWRESFEAWASNDPKRHEQVNKKIREYRERIDRNALPFTKAEMDSIPEFAEVLSTWNSMQFDYLTEMAHFRKPWLALFGEVDQVVPTEASVRNILHYMDLSGNPDYLVAIIPKCGHTPVNVETGQRILFENIVLNWLSRTGLMR